MVVSSCWVYPVYVSPQQFGHAAEPSEVRNSLMSASLTGSGITRRMAGGVRSVMFTAASVGQEMYHQCWNVIKGIFPNLSGMLPLHHEIVAALDGTRTEEERFALFGNPCLTRAGIAVPCLSSAEVKEEIQYFRRPLKSAQLWRARP